VCALAALVLVFVLSYLKSTWVSDYGHRKLEYAQTNNERIFNLFQASFYFYYDDQFKPGIEDFLKKNPELKRVLIISGNGQVAFDSKDLAGPSKTIPYKVDPQLAKRPSSAEVLSDPEGLGILVPAGQYSIYYVFSLSGITLKVFLILCAGLGVIGALWALSEVLRVPLVRRIAPLISAFRVYSLRSKFVATIVLVNLMTGAIIFVSQSSAQKNEQTQRLIRSSINLAELSKDSVIANFSNFFYFYYNDKFVPAIKHAIASKENLGLIRIISRKSGMVVFDSEDMIAGRAPVPGVEGKKADLSDDALGELRSHDTYSQVVYPSTGEPYIQVVTTYRNENQEAPFYVEYVFSFASLKDRIAKIQRQILLDLVPSMILGIIIAIVFAQLVVGPIKKLVDATNAITVGNYDVAVDTSKRDELGDLMRSFNGMALELKRKNELKKYLSDQSYRRIIEAPEGVTNIGGARVRATVLFCDIRNFVNVCETLDAEEVTGLLNEHFSNMVEVIYKHRGEVDKFIGDAILAVFYEQDNLKQPVNTALHAIYCAMEMRERLAEYNVKRVRDGKPVIEIGIGINSGEIISGPIGSPDRMDFTVIGDVVNLANRIEKLSKQGRHTRIVFSNRVEERVRGLLDYEELTREKIRGKEESVVVYELVKIKDVRELLSNLAHPDPSIKRHCIELLGYSRNLDALPHLYQKMSDSDEAVRIAAVTAVTRLAPKNHEQTIAILFRQLEQESSERVVSNLLIGIGKICTTEKILGLTKYLHDEDERIVANTIEALSGTDDPHVIDLLIPYVTSRHNRVKANAAMVLFAKGRVEVIDILKPMLLHSDHLMRASAAFALGELTLLASADTIAQKIKGDSRKAKHFLGELQSCVSLLVSLLKDHEPVVKRQAIVALGKIKDKTAVLPLLDNVNLETDSKEVVHDVAEALRSIGSHRLVREVVSQLG
jgi:class 3 adenylate cyclase